MVWKRQKEYEQRIQMWHDQTYLHRITPAISLKTDWREASMGQRPFVILKRNDGDFGRVGESAGSGERGMGSG